ncbi:MAG: segregation and condensation protein A [Tepidiformaceae bacterium]
MPEIRLPVFQGPLELLLHLIERDDLDITAVSLVAVTDQYLGAVRASEGFGPHVLAEFVSIAAKLIYLKSRALLPRAPGEPEAPLQEDEVGRELIDLLQEYRRFAEVADVLEERQEAGLRLYARMAPAPAPPEGPGLDDVTLDALRTIMLQVVARKPAGEPAGTIAPDTVVTVHERTLLFREQLHRHGKFSFRKAISECETRTDVVVAFLAILELLKTGECEAVQSQPWGDIEVVLADAVAAG